jgi:UPF0755 protein
MSENDEGYLFPDTYEFFENATTGEVYTRLRETFDLKTSELSKQVGPGGESFRDVMILASIIEEEVPEPEDRRIVSGILWKRLSIGMPLQVDATFQYTIGKGSFELTKEDLASDSPYNTYTRRGLPPTPIASPSLDAIDAALHPEKTGYLFYLSGTDGTTHYAKDFEGHKLNRAKYLR